MLFFRPIIVPKPPQKHFSKSVFPINIHLSKSVLSPKKHFSKGVFSKILAFLIALPYLCRRNYK